MNTTPALRSTTNAKSVLPFFLWAVVLIAPFLVFGALTGIQLAPGLPVAALGVFCPMLGALIMVYRDDKRAGMAALVRQLFNPNIKYGSAQDMNLFSYVIDYGIMTSLRPCKSLRCQAISISASGTASVSMLSLPFAANAQTFG